MRGPDGTLTGTTGPSPPRSSCRPPDRPALAEGGGRVTIPFLPTLATAIVLAVASIFCPTGPSPAPGPAARMIPAAGAASLVMAEPATPASEPVPRPPAVIAFSEIYPLAITPADPVTTAALPAPSALHAATGGPSATARPPRRLAVTGRRSCAGKRCQDTPSQDNPFAPAMQQTEARSTAEASTPAIPGSLPSALPFAETVVEVVVPVAREVRAGIGARVNQITGTAGDLVRGGESVVKGSVSLLADRLL